MKIWLRVNSLKPRSSWVVVWEELCKALKENGHEVFDDITTAPKDVENFIELWWGDPAFWEWSDFNISKVGYALSEARSIQAHGRWKALSNLQKCDLLCCPSFQASIAYLEAPLDIPIEIVPFGVDIQHFKYIKRTLSLPFKFLHLGVAQFRKGSWLVPEAFIKTFTKKDQVKLTISSFLPSKEVKLLEQEYGKHPDIIFNIKEVADPFDLYKEHHVLVSPHLSEGWGMCITEAMSTGMPCLIARCSTPREYFSKDYGWWIEMSEDYAPVSDCLTGTSGFWRLPDIESLCFNMRYIFDHQDEVLLKGDNASRYITENYTWKMSAEKLVQVINKHLNVKITETIWK